MWRSSRSPLGPRLHSIFEKEHRIAVAAVFAPVPALLAPSTPAIFARITMSQQPIHISEFTVESDNVVYTDEHITSQYDYRTTEVTVRDGKAVATPRSVAYEFRTARKKPKLGLMLVGWGGNNGCTTTAAILANKMGLSWNTKEGVKRANYFGSLTQASTVRLGGHGASCSDVWLPFGALLPMVHPDDLVLGGWDISSLDLAAAMGRSKVLDYELQAQLRDHMSVLKPLPSVYYPDFIAANQGERADNALPGADKQAHLDQIRKDIREFKAANGLDSVVVLWTANTERFAEVQRGVNDTSENLLKAIAASEAEIAPSTIFAVASILEGATYINGSPQNTFVPGVVELAEEKRAFIGGDDFKSGQTKMKCVMADFLIQAGIKPTSIVSYNHLGNNDGKNLSAPQTFRSKEISKAGVVEDMVASNRLLYAEGEHPDHVVVIKYVPRVGDSKRAMDEYTSEIFMGGTNTIVMHNTCEDSLLATPLILDLAILAELASRITYKKKGESEWHSFHPVLSLLSYMLKAPMVPPGTPVVNSLFKQRSCIENILRACVGLPPDSCMALEHKQGPSVADPNPAKKQKVTANGA